MSIVYRIQDEPTGRNAGKFVIHPFWPLLAFMFAGAWLAALLFAMNAWFLRGPTWRRELLLVAAMLIGAPIILFGIALADRTALLPAVAVKYAILLIVLWKLSFIYWIFFLQQTSYALYEYFEGRSGRNRQLSLGVIVLGVGVFIKSAVVTAFGSLFWQVMVN